MNTNKIKVQFIYIHELATAISNAILLRDHNNSFPDGVYKLDDEGVVELDQNYDPIYNDKAMAQKIEDYFYYYDLIEKHIVGENVDRSPKAIEVEQRDQKTAWFIERIKNLFKVIVFLGFTTGYTGLSCPLEKH